VSNCRLYEIGWKGILRTYDGHDEDDERVWRMDLAKAASLAHKLNRKKQIKVLKSSKYRAEMPRTRNPP
jgi:hypothetical protein